jgi:actin-related protein 6
MAGGKKTKATAPAAPTRTLVLDNGAHTIKAGYVASDSPQYALSPRVIPNCLARDRQKNIYIGSELDRCRDYGEIQYRRPVDKGCVVSWEAQKQVWDREFFDEDAITRCDPSETRLVLTEAPNSLPILQTNCDQIVFEEYQFGSYYRGVGKCNDRAWL